MTPGEPIMLEDVKRLRLEPGDTLVLRAAAPMEEEILDALREQMRAAFPDHRTLVLVGSDLDLTAVPEPPDPPPPTPGSGHLPSEMPDPVADLEPRLGRLPSEP